MKKRVYLLIAILVVILPINVHAICDKLAGDAYNTCTQHWNECLSRCEPLKSNQATAYNTCKNECDASYQNYDGVKTNNPGTNPGSGNSVTPGGNSTGTGNNATASKTKDVSEYSQKVVAAKEKKLKKTSCETLFGGQTGEMLKDIYKLIKFAVPIILIALSIKDFGKVIISQNGDEMKKTTSTFIKRLIISIVLLLGPTLIGFIFKVFGINICTL